MARNKHVRSCFTIEELPGLRFPWYTRMPLELWRPLRQYVYERDGGKCRYCGEVVELYKAHVHHVLDLQYSGVNHPSNLKVSCIPCHKEKHPWMKTVKEMYL